MPQFSVNPSRLDPYKRLKFRVRWDGRYVAGVSRVSPLRQATEVVTHREGGDPNRWRRSPGLTSHDPIRLERGRTHDTEFEDWARKVSSLERGPGADISLADFRKDVLLELQNEAGQLVMAFRIHRCWPSEYVAIDELEAGGSATAFESIVLQHEGWERDREVGEPQEPSFE